MNEEKITCTRCIMNNEADNTISFIEDGTCNYCNYALERKEKEYFPNEEGKKALDKIIEKIKYEGKDKKYDCMIGVSGGLDSSYLIYLAYKYGLRPLLIHVDDGLDTEIAKANIKNLCNKTNMKLEYIKPNKEQYADLIYSFFKASVPNIAIPQDNILKYSLSKYAKENNIKYVLSGANFALESILQRGNTHNACDKAHIIDIHNKFGRTKLKDIKLATYFDNYIKDKYINRIIKVLPLNYINYNMKETLNELKLFSDYNYYGGKHHESILTRFLQCYYLPNKFNVDKRTSHLSSMIVSDQLTREEALNIMKENNYSEEQKELDMDYIAKYLEISRQEFDEILKKQKKYHEDYKTSPLNKLAGIARKYRKVLDV